MTDPVRLLQSHIDEDARSVLEAARRAEPALGAQAQIWQSIAVGFPAGVLLGATTSGSAGAATATKLATLAATTEGTAATSVASGTASAVASGTASAVTSGTASAVVSTTTWAASGLGAIAGKAIAIGFGVGLAVHVGAGVGVRAFESVRATPVTSASAAFERSAKPPAAPVRAVPPPFQGPPPALDEPSVPKAKPISNEPTPDNQAVNGAPPTDSADLESDELREESALLLRARSALHALDATSALDALAAYRRRFPRGKLTQERDALEIQALVGLGRRDDARELARAFLGRYPGSPHAERIQAVLEESR